MIVLPFESWGPRGASGDRTNPDLKHEPGDLGIDKIARKTWTSRSGFDILEE
jgi:hypothetical protein